VYTCILGSLLTREHLGSTASGETLLIFSSVDYGRRKPRKKFRGREEEEEEEEEV